MPHMHLLDRLSLTLLSLDCNQAARVTLLHDNIILTILVRIVNLHSVRCDVFFLTSAGGRFVWIDEFACGLSAVKSTRKLPARRASNLVVSLPTLKQVRWLVPITLMIQERLQWILLPISSTIRVG